MEVGVPGYKATRSDPVGAKTFLTSLSSAKEAAVTARNVATRPTPRALRHKIICSLRLVCPLRGTRHLARILAAFTIGPHLSASARMKVTNASGVLPTGTEPFLAR